MTLEDEFLWAQNTPRDIHEHVPFLAELASGCRHVTEFGISLGMSDRGLLMGLQRPGCELVAYDVSIDPTASRLLAVAGVCKYTQIQANVLEVEIAETDMLFIDTLHNYDQLSAELALHANKVRKTLVFHDTVSFGYQDERPSGNGDLHGLIPAIEMFLRHHPEWVMREHRLNCNGLMVLGRSVGASGKIEEPLSSARAGRVRVTFADNP